MRGTNRFEQAKKIYYLYVFSCLSHIWRSVQLNHIMAPTIGLTKILFFVICTNDICARDQQRSYYDRSVLHKAKGPLTLLFILKINTFFRWHNADDRFSIRDVLLLPVFAVAFGNNPNTVPEHALDSTHIVLSYVCGLTYKALMPKLTRDSIYSWPIRRITTTTLNASGPNAKTMF